MDEWLAASKQEVVKQGFHAWFQKHEAEFFKRACLSPSTRSRIIDSLPFLCGLSPHLPPSETKASETRVGDSLPLLQGALQGTLHGTLQGTLQDHHVIPSHLKGITHTFSPFVNWGKTQQTRPYVTFYPTDRSEVVTIVEWAASEGKRVRCSGYSHTWAPFFPDANDAILICLVRESKIPFYAPLTNPTMVEFHQISIVHVDSKKLPPGKTLVKVGAGVTNDEFRVWCLAHSVTLPMNVVLVENTLVGTTSMCCHGSGIQQPTLSDQVWGVELVDSKGRVRSFTHESDTQIMRAVAGSFGLFGVIVSLTFICDPISYARMTPFVAKMEDIIPRVVAKDQEQKQEQEQKQKQVDEKEDKKEDKKEDSQKKTPPRLEDLVHQSYYNEFFFFSFQTDMWVNCWTNDGEAKDAVDFPDPKMVQYQQFQSFLAELADSCVLSRLPSNTQAHLLGSSAMAALARLPAVTTPLPNALHFQRGLHRLRVTDFECEIPLLPCKQDPSKPDLHIVRRAWWIAVDLLHEEQTKCDCSPVKLCLEMRVMNGSQVLMAPQRGNSWTCAIEVLSLVTTPKEEWLGFCNKLIRGWQGLLDEYKLGPLRPHWAKEHQYLSFREGQSTGDYLAEIYAPQIVEFNRVREQVDVDPRDMFSNSWLNQLFGKAQEKKKEQRHTKTSLLGSFSSLMCCTQDQD